MVERLYHSLLSSLNGSRIVFLSFDLASAAVPHYTHLDDLHFDQLIRVHFRSSRSRNNGADGASIQILSVEDARTADL